MSTNSTDNGAFWSNAITSPYIDIKISSIFSDPRYVSTLLHELGHFNHYQMNGGYTDYYDVHSLIKESYADYVSWYLSKAYYTAINAGTYNSYWDYYLQSPNQYWQKTSTSCYTPLFIDLVDDYNQRVDGTNYNNDQISGVPHYMMPTIVSGKKTWQALRSYLHVFVDINHCTNSEYLEFVAPYDYFISNN